MAEQDKGGGAAESSSGSASAVYDDSTGEIEITVDSVLCWNLVSADNFTGDDLGDLDEILPAGSAYNLLTRHEDAVGEAAFGATMTYSALDLGAIAATGLETTDFVLEFVTGYGESIEYGTITLAGGGSGGPRSTPDGFHATMDQTERTLLENALRDTGGNKTAAAAALGMKPSTFRDRLAKHGLG